ncbi:hypothetical protein MLD38_029317 [Melastoma candidum]|uniref:Uncharacterized protein n=1 Tax=Melastoma candidum TaxID=119954 RepID=A0ACB9N3K9_9MYRT|nr:hypothetical protein MLD38_029317 [Melastoma candidum]
MIRSIAERWRELSGRDNWKGLLNPLDLDLRRYIIHYGELAQATYDTFNSERASKYCGSSLFSRKNLFSRVGLTNSNPFQYRATKYIYATSQVRMPSCFIMKSLSREAWNKESNWIGYVAVATDEGKKVLGRRDIVVAWRGTIQMLEWANDFDFPLVSATQILGEGTNAMVHRGWLSMYTSDDKHSQFNKTSARDQVTKEVKRLIQKYKNEELSITCTGHSLGAALATLSSTDLAANHTSADESPAARSIPVTAFVYASPHVGDLNFTRTVHNLLDLHILRIRNFPDLIPTYPLIGYSDVGEELMIDTRLSGYLKRPGDIDSWHRLEGYLHGVAGTQGDGGGFKLALKRDPALVNKVGEVLRNKYRVPAAWWCLKNRGMVQLKDGSWTLDDHELDDPNDSDDDHPSP